MQLPVKQAHGKQLSNDNGKYCIVSFYIYKPRKCFLYNEHFCPFDFCPTIYNDSRDLRARIGPSHFTRCVGPRDNPVNITSIRINCVFGSTAKVTGRRNNLALSRSALGIRKCVSGKWLRNCLQEKIKYQKDVLSVYAIYE